MKRPFDFHSRLQFQSFQFFNQGNLHEIRPIARRASGIPVQAATLPFDLTITGEHFDVRRTIEISDLGEGKTDSAFQFTDKAGKTYAFDLKYKALPGNRSFPGNLDITLKDGAGNKLGYLFFAINGVDFLKRMGIFGMVVDVEGRPVDIRFDACPARKSGATAGGLKLSGLGNERLVLDVLVPKFDFQMIRPMIVPNAGPGLRSQSYSLDNHPYEVNYTLKDIGGGQVEFQSNLSRKAVGGPHLMQRVYFHAASLDTLREAMYASKFFDAQDGTFKLVYYPAMRQTTPGAEK